MSTGTKLTAAHRRILTALAEIGDEVLIYKPRRGFQRVGPDGPTASWKAFKGLEDAGLISVRHGFAVSQYATITDAGRAALPRGAQ